VNDKLAIVFEDEHCLALAKPPGQFTQGTWAPAGERTLEIAVREYLNPHDPGAAYLGIVHRLDRPTSGILLWAKTVKTARRLSALFEQRAVIKEYWAIVELKGAAAASARQHAEGAESSAAGVQVWSDWLTRANEVGVVAAVNPRTPGAREAVTHWRFGAAESLPPQCAWLQLWPQTGRTHQLRIQAALRGMPVAGDAAYGATQTFPVVNGIALHAQSIQFRHPITGKDMALVAPAPSSWAASGMIVPDRIERPDRSRA
jgi:23S rRNA pseudouridine1911/1915/1917 synthase